MADEYKNTNTEFTPTSHEETEVKDRGMFDFLKKKKEEEKKPEVEAMTSELEHVQVTSCDDHPEKKPDYFHQEKEEVKEHKPSLLEKFHHKDGEKEEVKEHKPSLLEKFHHKDGDSSSSSSSDEEVEENGEKIRRKKNKKGLKQTIKEKFGHDDTSVPIEKCDNELTPPPYSAPPAYESSYDHPPVEEKSNFIEKIQEKLDHDELPGGAHHVAPAVPDAHVAHVECSSTEHPVEEKKGFLEKIKEKLPGHKKQVESTEVATPVSPVECSTLDHAPPPTDHHDGEHKEKKGILEKIKEKLPGYHKNEDEHKEKEEKKDEGHY